MGTLSKSAAALMAVWAFTALAPAAAQQTAKPAKKAAGKAQAKAEPKKAASKPAANAPDKKANAKEAEPVQKAEPAHKPLEGELAHIARYDAAIAPVRDLGLSSEEAASL